MKMNITSSKNQVEKQLFQLKAPQRDGLILQIHNTPPGTKPKQSVRYTHLTIDKMGHLMAAISQKGDLLIVDFVHNKFWTIPTRYSCVALQFSPLNDCEVLLGCVKGDVKILNIETGAIVGTLKGHKYPITGISFSKDFYCLTSSTCEAILWNLRTNLELQNLNLLETTLLKFICFMPVTNNILACFQDDSMQVWTYDNFQSFRKILPSSWNKSSIKCIAITRNGRAMVVGGHTSYLAIFLLEVWQYTKTIKLPEYIQSVKSMEFISEPFDGGSNRILAILSGNGVIYFYSMAKEAVINKLLAVQEILRFCPSGDGKYLSCILSTGEINIYLLNKFLKEEDKKKESPKEQKPKRSFGDPFKKSSSVTCVQKELQQLLDQEKLQKILKEFGAYPDEHRVKIWTQLLQLPNNVLEYRVINNNGLKTPFDAIEKIYPLENKIDIKNLKRTLINICTWSPFFKNVEFLPVFIFPFVHVFQNEPILCFETICTVILNWCQHWYEYYPMAPINILAVIENVMLEHDIKLLRHLTERNITSEIYAWSMLEVAFSESLQPDNWRILWDHIFSNEPSFILFAAVAYSLINRNALLSMADRADFEFFYHNYNPINIKKLIAKTYQLLETTSEKNHPRQYLLSFRSMAGTNYPMFSDFPKASLECKTKELDELSLEEEALRQETAKLEKLLKQKDEEMCSMRREEIQEERIRELENLCQEKLRSECERIQRERKRIALLRKQLTEEETALLKAGTRKIKAYSATDRRVALEKMLSNINDRKINDEIDILNTETELIRHYSDLLKNRIEIENLCYSPLPKENSAEEVRTHQKLLLDEINKIQNLVDSKQYLKQLSIATGLAAMDSLIERVEKELQKPLNNKNSKANNGTIATLQAESLDLEMRVRELLSLIEEHKQMKSGKQPVKTSSLDTFNECFVNVTNLNSAEDLHFSRADGDIFREPNLTQS